MTCLRLCIEHKIDLKPIGGEENMIKLLKEFIKAVPHAREEVLYCLSKFTQINTETEAVELARAYKCKLEELP